MKERNYTVDLVKYFASLCIIAIHTEPFADFSFFLNLLSVQIVARLAVPFFAVCSGFFYLSYASSDDSSARSGIDSFLSQWKKLIWLYFVWSVLYLLFSIPMWIRSGWFSAGAFVDYAVDAVRSNSHYHLWYLLSLIYAWPLFCWFISHSKRRLWLPVSLTLYAVKVLDYAYYAFLPEQAKKIFSVLHYWSAMKDAVFLLLPLLILGAYLNGVGRKKLPVAAFAFFISFLCLGAEVFLLYKCGQKQFSYVFFTYPTAWLLFTMILEMRNPRNKALCSRLGKASLFIYCFHPMLVELLQAHGVSRGARFLIAAVCSTALGLLYTQIRKKNLKKV